MYNAEFFRTKLGQAALMSVAAMTAMVMLSSQMSLNVDGSHFAQPDAPSDIGSPIMVELA